MSRLIVKNIPTHLSEGNLKTHFDTVAPVTDVKIAFKGTRHRKFCFVGYKTEEAAKKAVEHFNNTFIGLNRVTVSQARTLDDPELPRAWSRYTQGSSAYGGQQGQQQQQGQSTQQGQYQQSQEDPLKKKVKVLEENPKYIEFMDLMKVRSAGTMSWTDNLNPASDNPKNRQKELNRLAKQAEADKIAEEEKATAEATNKIDEIFSRAKKTKKVEEAPTGALFDCKRLYVTNIPYNATNEEIQAVFERFGTVVELKLPRGRGGTLTGFCFVSFALPEEAARAYAELDNKIVMGRILHAKPALEADKPPEVKPEVVVQESSSYKRAKKSEMLKKLDDTSSWNTVFLNPNSILECVSQKYGVKKREILSAEGEDVAVRVAMAETQVVKETKEWLSSIGVKLDFLNGDKSSTERSTTTILVKNIQFKVTEQMLNEAFSRYGLVDQLHLSPNKSIAIVKFRDEQHATNAFTNLSYYKFHGSYFYLEWAPKTMLNQERQQSQKRIQEEDVQESTGNLAKIVYVKNLNFNTSDEALKRFFHEFNVQSVKVIYRDGLSMGYGFVEFVTPDDAQKALKRMQNQILDEHNLQLSQSRPKPVNQTGDRRKKQEQYTPSSKLVIRNLPFEANVNELRSLVKNYGDVKKVRLPKKLNGAHRGFAFAEFASLEEARNAFEALQSTHFYGRKLVIEYAVETPE